MVDAKTDVFLCSSVHDPRDTRIAVRELQGLERLGYRCRLVTSKPELANPGIETVSLFPFKRRLTRVALSWLSLYLAIRAQVDGSVVIVHDPELLAAATPLRRSGATVVFDVHENISGQVETKPYLTPRIAAALSGATPTALRILTKRLDAYILAEPGLEGTIEHDLPHAVVQNYVDVSEFDGVPNNFASPPSVAYVGGIYPGRCLEHLVAAWERSARSFALIIGGPGASGELGRLLRSISHSNFTFIDKRLDRHQVRDVLAGAWVGWSVLDATPNYYNAQPTKMFEYMAAGRPFIASDFPASRAILGSAKCGVLVDPDDPAEIDAAIRELLSDRSRIQLLSEEAAALVRAKYSWDSQLAALANLLAELGHPSPTS